MRAKVFYLFFLVIIIIINISCNNRNKIITETLEEMKSHPIKLSLDKMRCRSKEKDTIIRDSPNPIFKMVIYIDSTECSPCTLNNMYLWNNFIKENKQNKIKYIFIFAPKSKDIKSFYISLKSSKLKNTIFIDTAFVFKRENPQIPSEKIYHTFLLNNKDSIIYVGNPLGNNKIKEIFNRAIKSILFTKKTTNL